MKIEFYYEADLKPNERIIECADDWLFVLNDTVYKVTDSLSGSTEWDEIVAIAKGIGWRVVQ